MDIGPGFSTEHKRTPSGHEYQGLVVLVLLSDWLPGGGGTAMVPGSHAWVGDMLRSSSAVQEQGIVHNALNALCVERMLKAVKEQELMIEIPDTSRPNRSTNKREAAPAAAATGFTEPLRLKQIVGKAGDVVLMHPWLIHSGTTNLRSSPRLLANGMVRIKKECFEKNGHPLLGPVAVSEEVSEPVVKKRRL